MQKNGTGPSADRRLPAVGRGERRRLLEPGLRALEPEDPLDDRADDEEEQDRRLEDADEVGRDAGLDLHRRGARAHRPKGAPPGRSRSGSSARAGRRRSRRSRPSCRSRRHRVGRAEQVGRAGHAAEHARHGHRPDDQALRRHAGVAGRVGAGAGDPDLESARRPENRSQPYRTAMIGA